MNSTSPPSLPANVLLAEDDRDNRVIISTWLRRLGANVDIAENGRIAVETALAAMTEEAPYDLVLMDMQMPELDGYGATFQLRSCGYRGLIVAFTAHAEERDRDECLALGCDDYLAKPIDRARLRAVVERALATRPKPDDDEEDDGDLDVVIADFAASLPARAEAVKVSLAAGEWAQCARLLHQLRGCAGSYGFRDVGEVAARLEAALGASAGGASLDALARELVAACRPRAA